MQATERLMRLADFIQQNMEPILVDWEAFARTVWPRPDTDPAQGPRAGTMFTKVSWTQKEDCHASIDHRNP